MVILATILNFQKLMFYGCDVETFCFNRYSKLKHFIEKKQKYEQLKKKLFIYYQEHSNRVQWTKESAEVNILTLMRFVYICSATTIVVN
jgi:hypothetical protein